MHLVMPPIKKNCVKQASLRRGIICSEHFFSALNKANWILLWSLLKSNNLWLKSVPGSQILCLVHGPAPSWKREIEIKSKSKNRLKILTQKRIWLLERNKATDYFVAFWCTPYGTSSTGKVKHNHTRGLFLIQNEFTEDVTASRQRDKVQRATID